MLYVRRFMLMVAVAVMACGGVCGARPEPPEPANVAAVVTAYYHNSHADMLVSRILQSETLDHEGRYPNLELMSLYTDQTPERDISRDLMQKHGVPIFDTVEGALTLGWNDLPVDGVLLVAEHGDYPRSKTTQIQYPKRRLFEEVLKTFDETEETAPVFIDKHLADNWADAKWIYDQAQKRDIPLMAGSSLPTLWRYPAVDVERGAKLEEMVAVSYHTLDAYGFHALEMVQCLAEQRKGGETGIKSVRCLTGEDVWKAAEKGVYDTELLDAAIARLKRQPRAGKTLQELVPKPVLFVINYADGFRANVLTLNGAVAEWAVAWRGNGTPKIKSTLFYTQEARPFMHFSYLLRGIEHMFTTGDPAWPVERTLMTSGALDALLISRLRDGEVVKTPHLMFSYDSDWRWEQPPPPPRDRPIHGQ